MNTLIRCLCDGTSGTYTAEIPISGALVLQDLPCPLHSPPAPRERLLVRDNSRGGKLGEVMDYRSTSDGERVDLRPPGGGKEWLADPEYLEVVESHGEYHCPGCDTDAEARTVREVYGCDAGRHCTKATPEQRQEFERQIAERLAEPAR